MRQMMNRFNRAGFFVHDWEKEIAGEKARRKAEGVGIVNRFLSICLLLAAGILFGMKVQQYRTEQVAAGRNQIETTVAIVNQDLGVSVGGEVVNYASAVIETLGSEYTVVSAAVAQNGYENGNYGAIVTFPADFSANLLSVNEKEPEQSVISLVINPNLPEDRYIMLYSKLIDMQQYIDHSIAYAYVETVYHQLHLAQDEIDRLLVNDEYDMEAVNRVGLANYTQMLDLGDIPVIEFEPTSPDYTQFLTSAQSIADGINAVYLDSYAVAQNDFDAAEAQMINYEKEVYTQSVLWINDMNQWADALKVYVRQVEDYKQSLDDWREGASDFADLGRVYRENVDSFLVNQIDGVNKYRDDLMEWGNGVEGTLKASDSYLTAITLSTNQIGSEAEKVSELISTYNQKVSDLQVWYDYLQDYQDYLKAQTVSSPNAVTEPEQPKVSFPNEIDLPDIEADIIVISEGMEACVGDLRDCLDMELEEMPEVYSITESAPEMGEDMLNTLSGPPELTEDSPAVSAPTLPTKLDNAFNNIIHIFEMYNPQEYLNEQTRSEAQTYIARYASHLNSVDAAIRENNANNILLLNQVYNQYNDYLNQLRVAVHEVHNAEQENLAVNISELLETLKDTSSENHALMDSFVARMPNSRMKSTVNYQVVEHTVNPVSYSYSYINQTPYLINNDAALWWLIAFIIIALAGKGLIIIHNKIYKRLNMGTENESLR